MKVRVPVDPTIPVWATLFLVAVVSTLLSLADVLAFSQETRELPNFMQEKQLKIRDEVPDDAQAIFDLTAAAFEPKAYSDGTEAPIINQLRIDGDLTTSLVAVADGEVVGHVAFSPVTISGSSDGWYGLGPVSVRTDLQRTGIGSKIIRKGLSRLEANGAAGCALIGDPDYYGRFGFKSDGRLHYEELPDRLVQWLAFGDEDAEGVLEFCAAFQS
ncbi:N-acetyltransferase [Shimia sp.]|uniref:GNAT family N-acetyltransferase n=1 Tax=Shimia sp. TaxID=1954381 RepID=UPI00329946F2